MAREPIPVLCCWWCGREGRRGFTELSGVPAVCSNVKACDRRFPHREGRIKRQYK